MLQQPQKPEMQDLVQQLFQQKLVTDYIICRKAESFCNTRSQWSRQLWSQNRMHIWLVQIWNIHWSRSLLLIREAPLERRIGQCMVGFFRDIDLLLLRVLRWLEFRMINTAILFMVSNMPTMTTIGGNILIIYHLPKPIFAAHLYPDLDWAFPQNIELVPLVFERHQVSSTQQQHHQP